MDQTLQARLAARYFACFSENATALLHALPQPLRPHSAPCLPNTAVRLRFANLPKMA